LFLHLQLADSEGSLARKLRFHIFKEVRTKASFSHLQLADFEEARTKASFAIFAQLQLAGFEGSLARKLRFHQLAARSRGKNAPHHRPEP
jgi:hypothetical protein